MWLYPSRCKPAHFAIAIFLILSLRFSFDIRVDPDLFARLAVGSLVIAEGSVPLVDPFAFTPTKPVWIDHEWLSGLIFYLIWFFSGELGLYFFKLGAAFLTFLFLMWCQSIAGGSKEDQEGRFIWTLLLGTFVTLVWHTTVRSQTFTYLCIAFLLYAIASHSLQGRRVPLLFLLPIFPLWANAHGGFVVGLGFLGIHCVCGPPRWSDRFFSGSLLSLCLLSTLINPYGVEYWTFILDAILLHRELIGEWAPVSPFDIRALPVVLLLAVVGLSHRLGVRPMNIEFAALLTVSVIYGFKHFRFMPIPLMLGIAFYAQSFIMVSKRFARMVQYLGIPQLLKVSSIGLVVAGFCQLAYLVARCRDFTLDYQHFPVQEADWLRQNRSSGKILAHYRHGNYILWSAFPQFKVAVDGRYEEVYTNEDFKRAYDALDPLSVNHAQALAQIAPDFVIVDRRQFPQAQERDYGGQLVFQGVNMDVYEIASH